MTECNGECDACMEHCEECTCEDCHEAYMQDRFDGRRDAYD